MRAKLVLFVLPLFIVAAFGFSLPSVSASAQETMKQAEGGGQQAQKPRQRRGRGRMMRGVPKGVHACIDRLTEIASADPLAAYEGQPQEIVNNGLLWNDPKSRCSIGDDGKLRLKVSEMASAWQSKDAAKVRSLLQEIKSAAPQG
jgi:hypothetical protein